MSTRDLSSKHSLNEMIDVIEKVDVSYTEEPVEGYFICSRDYWDALTPKTKAKLIKKHPHLLNDFPEKQ